MTKEHSLALKIAEMCGVKDEVLILDIEKLILHFGHDNWKEGYSQCVEVTERSIAKTFAKKSETE